jgi:hypothetical protein
MNDGATFHIDEVGPLTEGVGPGSEFPSSIMVLLVDDQPLIGEAWMPSRSHRKCSRP